MRVEFLRVGLTRWKNRTSLPRRLIKQVDVVYYANKAACSRRTSKQSRILAAVVSYMPFTAAT